MAISGAGLCYGQTFVFEFRVCTEFEQDSQFKTGCVQVFGIQHAVAASKRIVIEVTFRHIPEYSRSFASFAGGFPRSRFLKLHTLHLDCG